MTAQAKSETRPISNVLARRLTWLEDHRTRMASDPTYREEVNREAAMSDKAWAERLRDERAVAAHVYTETRMKDSGIPAREQAYLEHWEDTESVRVAWTLLSQPSVTVLLLGGALGVGKTVAACVAAWQVPGSVRFVRAPDMVRHGAFDLEYWDDLAGCSALVIDDLGAEPLDEKGWALASILDLLTKRYDSQQKTWITLNLPIAEFFARYGRDGDRLRDRLRECGRYIEVNGPSLRGNHATP